jgi:parvulin-like peptidyl-prolyl isomerase
MRNTWGILSLALALSVFSACQKGCRKDQAPKKEDEAAAKTETPASEAAALVFGNVVSKTHLQKEENRAVENLKHLGRPVTDDLRKNLRGEVLKRLIDDEIVKKQAEANNLKLDRFERVAAVDEFKARAGGPSYFSQYLEQQKLTEEELTEILILQKLREKLIAQSGDIKDPTDEQVAQYYEANKVAYTHPETVKTRHILLKFASGEPQEKEDLVQKKAQQIFAEAKAPGAVFEKLVAKYSEGPSAANGGDLAPFARGKMVKAFEDAAFGAKPGEVVGPVKTDFGYHIILVENKVPEKTIPLAEVKEKIAEGLKRTLQARLSEEVLSTLRQKADVAIFDDSLSVEAYKKPSLAKNEPKKEVPAPSAP